MNKAQQFLARFNAVVQKFDKNLHCLASVAVGSYDSDHESVYTTHTVTVFRRGDAARSLAYITAESAELAEQQLENKIAALFPAAKVLASQDQRDAIVRLLNHPMITRQEKTAGLIRIGQYSPEEATTKAAELKARIDEREGQRGGVVEYAVVGEAYQVKPAA